MSNRDNVVDFRDPDRVNRESERRLRYYDGIAECPMDDSAHLAAQAVVHCGLCDDAGYRGPAVCDHVDRTEIYRRGMAKVRAALTKGNHP